MDIISPKESSDFIIQFLSTGPKSTSELLALLRTKKPHLTKQGFYAALRSLKKEEVIILYKKTVSLNTAWIGRMQEALSQISATYLDSPYMPEMLSLHEKESVSFTFSNSKTLDTFWGHAQSLLLTRIPVSEPLYAYDPHYWFYVARPDTEEQLIRNIEKSGRQFLMMVGGDTELDKTTQKRFAGSLLQYYRKELFSDRAYYISTIGDYLIEVTLDHHISEQVELLYTNNSRNNTETQESLRSLLEIKSRNKIRITRNHARALSLKKKFNSYFYIAS